jgi:hypothetical protein
MRLDGDRALLMLREANPIPDPADYRRLGDRAAADLPPQGDTEVIKVEGPPARRYRPKLSLAFSVATLMTLAVMSITFLVPALSGRDQPPFEDPVEALRALHQRPDQPWSEMSDLFALGAVVDYFGSSRTWDTPGQAEEWDFDVAIGGRATLESCRVDGDWGICRVQWTNSLMEAAGLPDVAQEWRAQLDDEGLIAILRAEAITPPALAEIRAWFTDFNQWICRHHLAEGRRLWDRRGTSKEFVDPDCTRTEWQWQPSGSPVTDAEEVLRLHDLYLADSDG